MMSAGQRKRARELVNSCVRNDSKRNKKQPSRHNNENKNLVKTSLIDEGIKKDKVIKPKQTSQHNIDPTDLVKSSLKEDVIKREKIFETKRSNNLPIEVETIDQSSKAEVIDSPLITIPSITDEELNMAIQSIYNDNSFGIPDTLLVDCSVDGLVDEKVIFCEESVPISNNVEIQQFDDYVGSRSNSPDSETSEHVKVITTAMVHSSSPKKLLSNNSLKSSAKISEVVCKENIVPTNILTIVCEKNTPSAKENCINLDKEAPEKLVNSDSSSKNLENIYLHSIEKEPNSPSIEENNIIVDDSVPVNQDSKQTEEVKYIQNTKEIKMNASKNLQEQKETIHSKSTEEKPVITIKANIQEQGIMIDNMNDKTNKYFDNVEVRPIEEVNVPEQKKMVDKIDNTDITSKNLDNNEVRSIEEVNANVLEQEKIIDKIANKDITSKNFENIAVRPIEEGNANAPEQEKNVDEIGNTDTTSKNIENIEVRPIEENINISRIQDIDITVDKNILEEEVEEKAVDDINNTFEDIDFIPVEENLGTTFDNTEKRPSRGRKRISADQNREIRKKRTNTNEDYVSAKGKEIKSKTFSGNDFHCLCPKKCTEKLSAENRKAEAEAACFFLQ